RIAGAGPSSQAFPIHLGTASGRVFGMNEPNLAGTQVIQHCIFVQFGGTIASRPHHPRYGLNHKKHWEGNMNEISAAGRKLAVILAIVSGFVSVPLMAPLLLVFGGIAAIKNNSEKNSRNFLITIVLILGATTLQAIPYIGSYLSTIFESLGLAFIGASMVAI